jgi:hypothetical protein
MILNNDNLLARNVIRARMVWSVIKPRLLSNYKDRMVGEKTARALQENVVVAKRKITDYNLQTSRLI